jgi:catechol 2,3-dioxygenase-like lactoylglutathione lyase family enzyme
MRVFVDDQDKALKFYTDVLGFVKKLDFPMGRFKWLTVVSPEEPEGTQLLLEPNELFPVPGQIPAAKTYQQEIYRQGISAATFFVGDVLNEYARLKKLGVTFTKGPTKAPGATFAVLDDTCGNLIQIVQVGF